MGGDQAARESRRLGILMVAPAVALTAVLVIYPLVKGFKSSLESGEATYGEPPEFVGLDNYRQVLQTSTATDAIVHTLIYVALAVTLCISGHCSRWAPGGVSQRTCQSLWTERTAP